MKPSNFSSRKKIALAMAIGGTAIIALAYATLKPQISAIELSAKADIWQPSILATPQTTPDDENYLSIHSLWELQTSKTPSSLTNKEAIVANQSNWRFRGVIKEGNLIFALIEVIAQDSKKPKFIRLSTGDLLPNMSKITHIDGQVLTIEVDGIETQFQLFNSPKTPTP
jgi:hypothetical protein